MCSCLHVLRIHVAYVTTGKIQISQIYTFFFLGGGTHPSIPEGAQSGLPKSPSAGRV